MCCQNQVSSGVSCVEAVQSNGFPPCVKVRWIDGASQEPFPTGGVASVPGCPERTFGRIAGEAFRDLLPATVGHRRRLERIVHCGHRTQETMVDPQEQVVFVGDPRCFRIPATLDACSNAPSESESTSTLRGTAFLACRVPCVNETPSRSGAISMASLRYCRSQIGTLEPRERGCYNHESRPFFLPRCA